MSPEGNDDVKSLLNQVDALVRDGRRLDAIGVVTEANREHPDERLEQRLVYLRHNGFNDLAIAPGLPEWPPTSAPDLFEGTTGVPEVAAADLTAETLASGILRHGCLLVRGLIGPQTVARLIDDIDAAFAALEAYADGAPVEDTTPWFSPFKAQPQYSIGPDRKFVTEGGGVWMVDSPRAMFDVFEAFDEMNIAEPLTGFLGERPALSVKKWTLRRVPTTSGTNWHQDGAFLGRDIRTVNLWLTLTHCGDDAPGLDLVPRRFEELAATGTDGALFDWSVGEPEVARVADGAPVVRPVFEAGDALLFDNMFLHRTAVDPAMTHSRYAIESWFFAPSKYPLDQVPLVF